MVCKKCSYYEKYVGLVLKLTWAQLHKKRTNLPHIFLGGVWGVWGMSMTNNIYVDLHVRIIGKDQLQIPLSMCASWVLFLHNVHFR